MNFNPCSHKAIYTILEAEKCDQDSVRGLRSYFTSFLSDNIKTLSDRLSNLSSGRVMRA